MGTKARDFSRNIGTGGGGANISIADVLPYLTTANVSELSNLYYSNDRVFANILLASINDLFDVDTENYTANVGFGLIWSGNLWIPGPVTANLSVLTTDDISEGNVNLYYTNTRVRSAIGALNPTIIYDENTGLFAANLEAVALSANTTDAIPEGFVNLYFTNARVYANLELAYLNTLYDVDYEVGSVPANSVLLYNVDTNRWEPEEITSLSVQVANVLSTLDNFTSDDIREGNVNFYLSTGRFQDLISNTSINDLLDVDTSSNLEIGKILGWDGLNWIPIEANLGALLAGGQFAEFSNIANVALFAEFSNFANTAIFAESAQTAVSSQFSETSGIANVALVAEVANSISGTFVAERANVANTVLTLSNFTTDNLPEGNALYFTSERVEANVRQMSIDILADVDTQNKFINDILIWDGNYWVPNSAVSALVQNNFVERSNVANTVLSLAGFTTDNIPEGNTNFYYSKNRANNDIADIVFGKSLTFRDLELTGNIAVTGSSAYFDVDEYKIYTNLVEIIPTTAVDGTGIYFGGGNIFLTYNEIGDALEVTSNFIVGGNIIPSQNGVFNIGSPEFKFRSAFFGATTVYLGNLRLSEGPDGELQIYNSLTGEAAPVALSNISATEFVVVNRLGTDGITELNSYIGGNAYQFITGTTGNLYLGIKKDNDIDNFSGIRVERINYNSTNVDSSVKIYTEREGVDNGSVERAIFGADGNITFNGNLIINGSGLIQITRATLSTNTEIISEYSNTDVAISYDNTAGVITVTKDGVYEATSILTLTEDWQDTPIKSQFIPTGTYIVQVIADDNAVGGGQVQEYYSGIMSWYSSDTNSGTADEISLHRAGAGPGNGTIFLRVQRTLTANSDDLKLQIAGTTTNSGISLYTFKFRRLL